MGGKTQGHLQLSGTTFGQIRWEASETKRTKFTLTRTFGSTKTNTLKERPLHVHIQLNSERNHGRLHLSLIPKVRRNIIHCLHDVTTGGQLDILTSAVTNTQTYLQFIIIVIIIFCFIEKRFAEDLCHTNII